MRQASRPRRNWHYSWLAMIGLAALGSSALFLTLSGDAASVQRVRPVEATPLPATLASVAAAPEAPATAAPGNGLVLQLALPPRSSQSVDADGDKGEPEPAPAPFAGNYPDTQDAPAAPAKVALSTVRNDAGEFARRDRLRQALALPPPARATDPASATEAAEAEAGTILELTIAGGDTLDGLFGANGLSRADLARILRLDAARGHLQILRPGDRIVVRHAGGEILALDRVLDEERLLRIVREGDTFTTAISVNPVERRTAHAHGVIESSLFRAAQKAGISDTLIMELAGVFAWDIDFVLDIRRGDTFTVLYEEIWQDGEKLRDGEIIAAEFVNSGTEFRAVRFEDPDGNVGYFTPDGHNVKKAFLRAPIAITPRVTSNFNPRRLHPVHKIVRPHKGVDYGAPSGTPIKAAGDGKVLFRGRKGGYGNAVILQHGGNITTLYAHMSRFHKRARVGQRVKQGQTIGYVGATGTVTAAHLHYEYRVGGVHRNPRTVKLPQAQPVARAYRDAFVATTTPLLERLDRVGRLLRLAGADADVIE